MRMKWLLPIGALGFAVLSGCGGGGGGLRNDPLSIAYFTEFVEGNPELFKIDIRNGAVTRITNTPTSETMPDVSPDGAKLAFIRESRLWTMNADGTGAVQLITVSSQTQPDWSPDGTKIVFISETSGKQNIHVINADGSNEVQVTNSAINLQNPTWSPDGTKILFDKANEDDIYIINADGTGETQLSATAFDSSYAAFNPLGTLIAFMEDTAQGTDLRRMNADGSGSVVLVSGSVDSLTWGKNGRLLYIQANNGGMNSTANGIYLMSSDLTTSILLADRAVTARDPSLP